MAARRSVLVTAAALALAACAAGPRPAPTPDLAARGINELQSGQVAAAAATFRQAIAAGQDSPGVHYHLGLALAGSDDRAGAIEAYGRAAALDPRMADARANRGLLLLAAGRLAEAEADFAELRLLEPGSADGPALLAQVELARDRPAAARPLLEQALALAPDRPELRAETVRVLLGLARAAHDQGDPAAAEPLYGRAIELDPVCLAAQYHLGRLLAAGGRTDEAVARFDAVLAARPDDIDALGQKAMALAEAGRLAAALPFLRRFVEQAPPEYAAHVEQFRAWIVRAEAGR